MKPQFIIDCESTLKNNLLVLIPDSEKTALLLAPHAKKIPGTLSYQIPSQSTYAVFTTIAGKADLLFKDKALVIDLFSRSEFFYKAEKVEGNFSVQGWVVHRQTPLAIKECLFVGPGDPVWYIQGISLKFIAEELSWKELKKAFVEKQALSLEELQELIKNPQEGLPKVKFDGGALPSIDAILEPLPFLKLTDRTGAFANLFMRYEQSGRVYELAYPASQLDRAPFKRNSALEKNWEKDLLETGYIFKPDHSSHYYCSMEKVAKTLSFLLELGWKIEDNRGNHLIRKSAFEINAEDFGQKIKLSGKMRFQNHTADLSDVIGAFNRKERFIELGSGTVGLFDANEVAGIAEEVEVAGQDAFLKKQNIGALDELLSSLKNNFSLDQPLKELHQRLFDKSLQRTNASQDAFSTKFKGELRPYQALGVSWLKSLYQYKLHGLLADDMGLGKTVQTIAFLASFPEDAKTLIVLPRSLIFNWEAECKKFFPEKKLYIHHGAKRAQNSDSFEKAITLTTYATLRSDLPLLQTIFWDCLILDEAQQIKNSESLTAQAAFQLRSAFKLSITGTPVENHMGELWSQFHFLIPDLLGENQDFKAKVLAANSDYRYIEQIKRKIAPFILRRKKEEVAKELPPKIEQVVFVEMEEEERRFYDNFLASLKGGLVEKVNQDGLSKHRMEIFEAILRLRQICCHPLLIASQSETAPALFSQKFTQLMEDLETLYEEGAKVLIYSQFTEMLSLMKAHALKKNWRFSSLDGQTKDRQAPVEKFQNDPETRLFFLSLKAGGVGLNLTAAEYVLLYDPWWNLAAENQAIDRAHRIGQQKTVIAKRYIVKESIEEKMMIIKEKKQLLSEALVDDSSLHGHLTEEDFKFLLDL